MKLRRFLAITLSITMGFIFSLYTNVSADITTGLVAYYPFNGNANDETGNGHNGTVYGATLTTDRNGTANSAYNFESGNGYIEVPHSDELNPENFTISLWVNFDSAYEGAVIVNKCDWGSATSGSGYYIHLSPSDKGIFLAINDDEYRHYSYHIPNLNEWVHIVATYAQSSGTTELYIDGNSLGEQSGAPSMHKTTNPLLFGKKDAHGTYGLIDDIRIYNRVLSEEDIQELYGGTSAGELIGYWKFDEGSGSIAYDSSGNGNDGTINNATWTENGDCGSALKFDGNGYVTVGDLELFDFSATDSAFTVGAWVNMTQAPSTTDQFIGKMEEFGNKGWFCGQGYPGGNFIMALFENTTERVIVRTDDAFQTGEWYYITWVVDVGNDVFKIFVNGVEQPVSHVGDLQTLVDIQENNAPLRMAATYSYSNLADAIIDEVRIYNQALSEDEIIAAMNECDPKASTTTTTTDGDTTTTTSIDGDTTTTSSIDDDKGDLGEPCYDDGTCNEGLICVGLICMKCPIAFALENDEAQLDITRDFRDNVLKQTPTGQEIIRLYYEWSPVLLKAMEEDEEFKTQVKEMIDGILPLITEETE